MLVPDTWRLLDQLLEIRPVYGWGWSRMDVRKPLDFYDIDAAGPLRARLTRLWEWRDELRGGIARVEHPGHPYNGYWVVFWTMSVGTWELSGGPPPRIDVDIGPDEPQFTDDWPSIDTGTPRIRGYVSIRPWEDFG